MSLIQRLSTLEPDETCDSLFAAALERYWDGLTLATEATGNRSLGAIYLLGYVAEVYLKVAFYRASGFLPADSVNRKLIESHRAWTKKKNLHDLVALCQLVIDQRRLVGDPLDPIFASQLVLNARALAAHWREFLRYRSEPAQETELREVSQSVEWLLAQRSQLWS